MRGADPAIVLVPGVGMFSFGKDKQTARVAGEFYVNAINVMRGAESLSTYAPIDESEKFRIEYWALEEAKLARMPKPKPLATQIALVTGAGLRHRQGHRRRGSPPRAPASSSPTSTWTQAQAAAAEIGGGRRRRRRAGRRHRRGRRAGDGRRGRCSRSAASTSSSTTPGCRSSKPLLETTDADWDLQHDVMAKGSFLVSRAAARVLIEQGLGGDIVYISSQELRLRRPEQHRLPRGQGRPGPPGAAARRRARRARHQGQRHQPRRRGAGLRHLRRRLGRQARRGLRRARGGARRVLRPAHPAQARGAARARAPTPCSP